MFFFLEGQMREALHPKTIMAAVNERVVFPTSPMSATEFQSMPESSALERRP